MTVFWVKATENKTAKNAASTGDKTREGMISETCSTHVGNEKCLQNFAAPEGKEQFGRKRQVEGAVLN
jgi:hypothetical protein